MGRPTRDRRRPVPALPVLLTLLVLLVAGCRARSEPLALAVGATADPESVLLAQIYAGALRGSGRAARVEIVADPLAGLDSGALDVVPDFTGRLLAAFAPGAEVRSDRQVYRAMVGALPEGIAAGDYATAAEDKPTLAITRATARLWGGADLRVLSNHCASVVIGARAGFAAPATVGRCRLPLARTFPDDAALFAALRAGTIVAAWTSTADPGIPRDPNGPHELGGPSGPSDPSGIVLLSDTKPALVRAENVVPLYRRHELAESQLLAINQVAGALDTQALVELRHQLAGGADPQAVAEMWLSEHPLGR